MGGLDELVDDVDKEQDKDEIEGMLDQLGIESKEELQKLEARLDGINEGLMTYDKRMERIENRLAIMEQALAKLIEEQEDSDSQESSSEKESTDENSSFDW